MMPHAPADEPDDRTKQPRSTRTLPHPAATVPPVSTRALLAMAALLPLGLALRRLGEAGVVDRDVAALGWVGVVVGGAVLAGIVVREVVRVRR